jgi:hypothetical protein
MGGAGGGMGGAGGAGGGSADCSQGSKNCKACLAITGCNWTASMCADQCIADADCFGPGNPAAPNCP